MMHRAVAKVVESRWQSEGMGARVRRSIGRKELTNLDPFLLLDEFEARLVFCAVPIINHFLSSSRVPTALAFPTTLTGASRRSLTSWRGSSPTRTSPAGRASFARVTCSG